MNWTAERVVRETQNISSLPTVYHQLSAAIDDPNSSNRDIEQVICTDSGLTARLLRVANSALYSFPSKIDTISRAITVLGTAQLRDLALATSVFTIFEGVSSERLDTRDFWSHSVACAVVARILAGYRHEANVERFFVAALLHDLGRLLMFMTIPELAGKALDHAAASQTLLFRAEHDIIGFDHAAVGSLLLKSWKLPEHTVNAVKYHHRPSIAGGPQVDAAIVHLADILTSAMRLGASGEGFVPPLDAAAWDQLGLSPSVLAPTLEQTAHQFSEAIKVILPQSS
ncbi:MAG TPA: HDOD domain-containing protein [Gammaproteobacteria bacterium]|nr:HDOD domain-containing protein [Gammaproteobacteria bacterium]